MPDEDCIVDEWTIAPSLSMGKRCLHSSSQLGGRVLVLGGHNGYSGSFPLLRTVDSNLGRNHTAAPPKI